MLVVTNHGELRTKGKKTGLWLSELTDFYHEVKVLYEVDIVSTSTSRVPIDPRSLLGLLTSKKTRTYYMDDEFIAKLRNPMSIDEVNPDEYAAIYFAGGHGTMWDFPDNPSLQEAARKIYENGGIVSAVCHGPAALCNVRLSDGEYLLSGHVTTGFADFEERLIRMNNELPFSLEQKLKERGALYKMAKIPFTACIAESGRVITGQNPASAKGVALRVLKQLNANKEAHV